MNRNCAYYVQCSLSPDHPSGTMLICFNCWDALGRPDATTFEDIWLLRDSIKDEDTQKLLTHCDHCREKFPFVSIADIHEVEARLRDKWW